MYKKIFFSELPLHVASNFGRGSKIWARNFRPVAIQCFGTMQIKIQFCIRHVNGFKDIGKAIIEKVNHNALKMSQLQKFTQKIKITANNIYPFKCITSHRYIIVDGRNINFPAKRLICLYPGMDETHIVFVFQRRIPGCYHQNISA